VFQLETLAGEHNQFTYDSCGTMEAGLKEPGLDAAEVVAFGALDLCGQ